MAGQPTAPTDSAAVQKMLQKMKESGEPSPPNTPQPPKDTRKRLDVFAPQDHGHPLKISPDDAKRTKIYPLAIYTNKGPPEEKITYQLQTGNDLVVARKVNKTSGEFMDEYLVFTYKPVEPPDTSQDSWDKNPCPDRETLKTALQEHDDSINFDQWQKQRGPTPVAILREACHLAHINPNQLPKEFFLKGSSKAIPTNTYTQDAIPADTRRLLTQIGQTHATNRKDLVALFKDHAAKKINITTKENQSKIDAIATANKEAKADQIVNSIDEYTCPALKLALKNFFVNNPNIQPDTLQNSNLTTKARYALQLAQRGDPRMFIEECTNLAITGYDRTEQDLRAAAQKDINTLRETCQTEIDILAETLQAKGFHLQLLSAQGLYPWSAGSLAQFTTLDDLIALDRQITKINSAPSQQLLIRLQTIRNQQHLFDSEATKHFKKLAHVMDGYICTIPHIEPIPWLYEIDQNLRKLEQQCNLRSPEKIKTPSEPTPISKFKKGLTRDTKDKIIRESQQLMAETEKQIKKLLKAYSDENSIASSAYISLERERAKLQQMVKLLTEYQAAIDFVNIMDCQRDRICPNMQLMMFAKKITESLHLAENCLAVLPKSSSELTIVDQIPIKNKEGEIVMHTPSSEEFSKGVPIAIADPLAAKVRLFSKTKHSDAGAIIDDDQGIAGQIKAARATVDNFIKIHDPDVPIVLTQNNTKDSSAIKALVKELLSHDIPPDEISIRFNGKKQTATKFMNLAPPRRLTLTGG